MAKNPVLELALDQVVKPEIALVLAQVHGIYTVGGFLRAWRSPTKARAVSTAFETPAQARHAAATCAAWLGVKFFALPDAPVGWWNNDPTPRLSA